MTPKQTLKSFTPINQGHASISAAKDVKIRPRGLDSDVLYDVPDMPLADLPTPKKKRKVSTKPARPKKTPVLTLAHPWPKAKERESSQPSTPPNARKRSSTRSSNQIELFSSAAITKPILGPIKLITTQDALKSKSAYLGQTTMDKLASFRLEPTAQSLSDVEPNRLADSTAKAFAETGKADKPLHDITSHERDTPNHAFQGHDPASHNELNLYNVFDDDELMSYNEDELDEEGDYRKRTCCNPDNPYQILDEAAMLDRDCNMALLDDEGISTVQRGTAMVAQPESEDDFPLDDDLEAEMLQLSMPGKIHGNHSPKADLRSIQTKVLQSTDTNIVPSQPSSSTLYTAISDHAAHITTRGDGDSSVNSVTYRGTVPGLFDEAIDWSSINDGEYDGLSIREEDRPMTVPFHTNLAKTKILAENDDYSPLEPFARPPFPSKVRDRSLITGISSSIILRTCFRIGEALREGALCEGLEQDAIIELFARVRDSSSSTINPSKLYFEFADLFHDRPPFICGTLERNRISGLQETESRMFQRVNGSRPMTRCLGRLKRIISVPPGWMLYIINIRPTDWEEVRWTRQIAGAGMEKG